MTWNDEWGDEISGVVIAVNGNAVTIRTDDGREITLGKANKVMDPNWTLIEARNAVGDYRNAVSVPEVESAAQKLADHFEALDEWLTKGGFLPADWLPATDHNKTRTLGNLAAGLPLRVQRESASDMINPRIVVSEAGYQQLLDEMTEEEGLDDEK